MKYLKLILFTTFILLYDCGLSQFEENIILEDKVISVRYLKSYIRENKAGVLQTISAPCDVILIFEDEIPEEEHNIQHFRIIELYAKVTETTIERYYKVDFKEINLDTNEETIYNRGIYFDSEYIETYSIGENGILLSSNESINGMKIRYSNDQLKISGEGEIILIRASENDIKNILPSNDDEVAYCRFLVMITINKIFIE